jgi:phosphoglycolate phosphatase
MKLVQPKAILFDLDGTLVDTAPDFYDVVNSLRADEGLAALEHERIREQVSNGGIALACLTFEVTADHPEIQAYRMRVLDKYSACLGSLSGYFPGFAETIKAIEATGIRWGIATNKPRAYTDPLLTNLGIRCDSVICPEDVSQSKPAPDALLLAAQQLNINAKNCWYVGDHKRDMEAAKAAGMLAIAARFGYLEAHDDGSSWPVDHWIEQPTDLLTLIAAH